MGNVERQWDENSTPKYQVTPRSKTRKAAIEKLPKITQQTKAAEPAFSSPQRGADYYIDMDKRIWSFVRKPEYRGLFDAKDLKCVGSTGQYVFKGVRLQFKLHHQTKELYVKRGDGYQTFEQWIDRRFFQSKEKTLQDDFDEIASLQMMLEKNRIKL